MTKEEAIKHCKEVAEEQRKLSDTLWDSREEAKCRECAKEHEQLAIWLTQLDTIEKEFVRLYDQMLDMQISRRDAEEAMLTKCEKVFVLRGKNENNNI